MKRLATMAVFVALAGCAAQSHHRTGIAALARQDFPLAVGELAQATQLKPDSVEYRRDWLRARENATARLLLNASAAIARGERTGAQQAYESVLKYDPDNARARAGLDSLAAMARADEEVAAARDAIKAGDVSRAAELLASALKRVPAQPEALKLRAELDAIQPQHSMNAPSLGAAYRKPINLEFRDASLKIVFDALSRTTGINFIFDRDVKADQRTTVFLKQTALDDAIDVILSTGQLEKKVLNASSVLIYPNTPAKLKEYQDLVVRAFYMANIEAKQAATMLKTVLKLKDIYVDDKYNLLVLRETPETISLAERLIRLQDLEEPEVMLEVEVLEINRTRLLNAGVQWNSQLTITPLGTTSSVPVNGTSTSAMKLSDLRNLNSTQIGITVPSATINLQRTVGDANLLANPRIRVRDREKAKIMIGDKVPVVTTTSTNTFVTENIQYLDVGLKLEVEPDIHLRDEIGLKIGLEVSSLVSSVKTNNGSAAYQIGTRNVNTALRLKDGETQVLAGLISDEDRASGNRIPLLGDFPILGRLFGSQSDSTQKTEVVLSITPHLIRNIARRDPGQEAFWSGTELTLRDRPLQLRTVDAAGAAAGAGPAQAAVPAGASAPAGDAAVTPASGPDAPRFAWSGPASVKAGETVTLKLAMDSPKALRAASLQLGFNPAEFDIVSIDDGGYFNKGGKGAFSKSVDAASGRASIGFGNDAGDAKGEAAILTVTLRARTAAPEAQVSLIAMTPIGASTAVSRPALPATHRIPITP
jgi:general secretion pathway protein D